ncbi:hypothetical protein L6164_035208 [Bauhinia variegata]|uniref:Uncharacterized protein n=1 Tax=Bauhinia variegata TaxID=167791 RepID=A0ACB9KXE7_BAUVA|nr:hypothetical protein L6164_035208 [Bauhinia variegata]
MRGNNSGNYRNPCLTMHQPWASLLVHGIKRIEGRSWPAPIRGRLWIHAASKVPDESTIKAMEYFYREIYAINGITDIKFPENYPVSRLLGCVEVVGCIKREELAGWKMVPEGVRLEAQTDYCWLCEQPQKLLIPFEMRGYQGVYNLERKIYEAAVRGLSPVESPLPVKFPLPDVRDPFSLKPGSTSALHPNLTASEVDSSSSLSLAIAGAQAAATQFSKKDHNSQSTVEHSVHDKMNAGHGEANNEKSYNLRSRSRSVKEDKISSTNFNEKCEDRVLPLHEEKSSEYSQSTGADLRQHHQRGLASSSEENSNFEKYERSSKHNQYPGEYLRQPQPPSKIFAAAVRSLKPS